MRPNTAANHNADKLGGDKLENLAATLSDAWSGLAPDALLSAAQAQFRGSLAVVSSFGTEAALVLQFAARLDRNLPVIFLDTGKHFGETLTYRDILIDRFGFTDARAIAPDPADLAAHDPNGDLWSTNPNLCCHLRKTLPLERALGGFNAWITGRKRYQNETRSSLPLVEAANGKIKINPLAAWSEQKVRDAFQALRLPPHPLFDSGYASIGCAPCTRRIVTGEDSRAGRWPGFDKTECGIHEPSAVTPVFSQAS